VDHCCRAPTDRLAAQVDQPLPNWPRAPPMYRYHQNATHRWQRCHSHYPRVPPHVRVVISGYYGHSGNGDDWSSHHGSAGLELYAVHGIGNNLHTPGPNPSDQPLPLLAVHAAPWAGPTTPSGSCLQLQPRKKPAQAHCPPEPKQPSAPPRMPVPLDRAPCHQP